MHLANLVQDTLLHFTKIRPTLTKKFFLTNEACCTKYFRLDKRKQFHLVNKCIAFADSNFEILLSTFRSLGEKNISLNIGLGV